LPSAAMNRRAGMSSNTSVGAPCETKTAGIVDTTLTARIGAAQLE
jgi:hypothetical protein